jgi:cobalamin biosynthesis protein CobD/CbiB
MRPPEDDVLLRDMVDHARKAMAATAGRTRSDLDTDDVLAAALERFIEVIGRGNWSALLTFLPDDSGPGLS